MADQPTWIMQVPVISTGHITRLTNQLLINGERFNGNEIDDMEGGWLCYVGAVEGLDEAYPADLLTCLLWAKTAGYEWLRLDQDGEQIDAIPYYDNW